MYKKTGKDILGLQLNRVTAPIYTQTTVLNGSLLRGVFVETAKISHHYILNVQTGYVYQSKGIQPKKMSLKCRFLSIKWEKSAIKLIR